MVPLWSLSAVAYNMYCHRNWKQRQVYAEPLNGSYVPLYSLGPHCQSNFQSHFWKQEFHTASSAALTDKRNVTRTTEVIIGGAFCSQKWLNKNSGLTRFPCGCPWHNPVRTQKSVLNVKIIQKLVTREKSFLQLRIFTQQASFSWFAYLARPIQEADTSLGQTQEKQTYQIWFSSKICPFYSWNFSS